MLYDDLRRAMAQARPNDLPDLTSAMWRAWGAGEISEAQVTALSELAEVCQAIPAAPTAPRKRTGSRPRTDASLARRRGWAASGYLPRRIAAHFTTGEHAALAVVAAEVVRLGRCELSHGQIAALAGLSVSLVKNALRQARALGLLTIEERRVSRFRNLTNVVRIIAGEWGAWLRSRGARGRASPCGQGGVRSVAGTTYKGSNTAEKRLVPPKKFAEERQGDGSSVDNPLTCSRRA